MALVGPRRRRRERVALAQPRAFRLRRALGVRGARGGGGGRLASRRGGVPGVQTQRGIEEPKRRVRVSHLQRSVGAPDVRGDVRWVAFDGVRRVVARADVPPELERA